MQNPNSERSEPLLNTYLDAAHKLAVGRSSIIELCKSGQLEVVHVGRCARIPTASLAAYVARLRGAA